MIILGMDPALTRTGYALINTKDQQNIFYITSGLIETEEKDSLHNRLFFIYENLKKIIIAYNPDVIALEIPYVNKNFASSMKLGMVRGVCSILPAEFNKIIKEITPAQIKKIVTGNGSATKQQVSKMLTYYITNLPKSFKHLDETDALSVAYACMFIKT